MTKEELKGHCERQIQQFERVEKIMAVTPNDWKRYEEHKLILELLEQTRWIPVSEKLPEEFESVLVYYKSQGGIAQCVSERLVNIDGSNRWSVIYGREPIAWMPLPEPANYKE